MAKSSKKIPGGLQHSFWGVLDAAVYPAIYMAMVPVLMDGLGIVAFGLWVVLNTLITTLQLFNLNIGLTTIRNISFYAATGNTGKVNDLINGVLRITALLMVPVILIGILLVVLEPYIEIPGIYNLPLIDMATCILLSVGIAGAKYFDKVFQGILKAYEQYKKAAILNIINRTGLLGINVLLALNGATVTDLLGANIVFILIYLGVHLIIIIRSLPFLKISLFKNRKLSRYLLSYSKWPWLQSVFVVIAFQTDRFWIAGYAGLEEAAAYGLTATMFNHIHLIFMAMTGWMLPRISAMVAKGENPALIYRQVRGLLLGVAVISLLLFYYCSPFLFTFWIGETTYHLMMDYIKAFVVFELLFIHTIMPFFYLNAVGKEKIATVITFWYCLGCYGCMVLGLLLFKNPLFLIHGMTFSLCITMPLVNNRVRKIMNKHPDWKTSLGEMMPIYLAIGVVYIPELWIGLLLIPLEAGLLYNYYLISFFRKKTCRLPAKI